MDILCIIGVPNHTQTPTSPSPTLTIQLIEFTYCHDRFPDQALIHKDIKYDSLLNTIQNNGWKTNPLITVTAGVRGAIHKHSIKLTMNKLTNLKIPKTNHSNPHENYAPERHQISHIPFTKQKKT